MGREKLLVLDFDGTLCLGEDPVLAYAAQVQQMLQAQGLTTASGRAVSDIVQHALASDDVGVPDLVDLPEDRQPQDGYQLTTRLGRAAGLSSNETGQCFREARRALLDRGLESTDIHAPEGAAYLLAGLREKAVVVLITNSPRTGFGAWLQALGLVDAFDVVVNDAFKPNGMRKALERARAKVPGGPDIQGENVMAVGDIWRNDCSHVHSTGGATVLIDRFGTGRGDPTHRVGAWSEAAGRITAWAS